MRRNRRTQIKSSYLGDVTRAGAPPPTDKANKPTRVHATDACLSSPGSLSMNCFTTPHASCRSVAGDVDPCGTGPSLRPSSSYRTPSTSLEKRHRREGRGTKMYTSKYARTFVRAFLRRERCRWSTRVVQECAGPKGRTQINQEAEGGIWNDHQTAGVLRKHVSRGAVVFAPRSCLHNSDLALAEASRLLWCCISIDPRFSTTAHQSAKSCERRGRFSPTKYCFRILSSTVGRPDFLVFVQRAAGDPCVVLSVLRESTCFIRHTKGPFLLSLGVKTMYCSKREHDVLERNITTKAWWSST